MLENIDIHSSVAVYVQIENHIQFAIASGKLKATDQLPSVRELSERLGVNPNTVAKSYRDLEVMGYLYTRRGMGVFIAEGIHAKCRVEVKRKIIKRLHEATLEARAAGMTKGQVNEICDRSYSSKGVLYGETPANVLALAKK